MKQLALILSLCLTLSGCGLHLRGAENFPTTLRQLSLKHDNVYQGITAELKRLLLASKVQLQNQAAIQLTLRNSCFNTDFPIVFSSASAHNYVYLLSVNFTLEKNGKTVVNRRFQVQKSLTFNVNQVGKPTVPPLMRERLTEALVTQIYHFLTSTTLQQKINSHGKHA